ncbi:WhiB family transcriptional regulator [Micromonospora chersina]|uniref:WhiB family transcriptional regulator n=1 Tax=Micromonospora chersina TaxID=47854 RepID=UPI0037224401
MTARLPHRGDVPDWHADGLCQQVDAELFFPERGQSAEPAKSICQRCPVQRDCLNWSLAKREPFGVWGGLSEPERRRVLSGKQRLAAA